MKKVILPLIFLLSIPVFLKSQEVNTRIIDPRLDREILIDYCDRDGLETGKFGELYDEYYPIYEPSKVIIKELKQYRDDLEIIIILGTWCSDSQEQVPKFMKVLDKIKFREKSLTMICVNRDKQGNRVDVSDYNIVYVPTFIFMKDGKEIGRIVEKPIRTLEEDMLGIVGE